ncbi:hypothetical protein EUTSA_v10029256mg [Eutrema salsugineum]|uniref:MADS-box domain-containing protein n=1 Tax=Eutrema salsugineum TaxID=72664 RepID=V4L4E2_EUTSA|nr:agamous-like MADS-box protein AGL97 [Eutrema salsugineum]ESQ38499.1 hypothetical protein EUTSA_v10029256mg [Eutrema salsugineum]
MVKRGGTKRKIPMEKITKKESLATAFSKRSYGLFSKASQLCLLSDAQIAVLATPPSSNSNVSFFSFGHSSVDSVVSAFLKGKRLPPVAREETREEDIGVCLARKDLGLGLWWEDEVLAQSENPQELMDAMNSMSSLLRKFKELRCVGSNPNSDQTLIRQLGNEKSEPDQTLIPDSALPASFNEMTEEQSQVSSNSDQTLTRQFDNEKSEPGQTLIPDDDLPASFNAMTEEQSQIVAICESFCGTEEKNNINNNNDDDKGLTGSLDVGFDQEVDIDQLIDFDMAFDTSVFDVCLLESTQEETTGSLLINSDPISVSQGFEEDAMLHQTRALDQDSLRFSDFYNTIAAV